jgi:chromosome segregation ATPase
MPDSTLITSLITLAGTLIVAAIGVYTARLAIRSSKAQRILEQHTGVIEGYGKLNDDLQRANTTLTETVNQLRGRIDILETDQSEARRRIYELESQVYRYRQTLNQVEDYSQSLSRALISAGAPIPPPSPEVEAWRAGSGRNRRPSDPDPDREDPDARDLRP